MDTCVLKTLTEMYEARGYTILEKNENEVIARVNKPIKERLNIFEVVNKLNSFLENPINISQKEHNYLVIGKYFETSAKIKEWLLENFQKYYIITIICSRNIHSLKKIENLTSNLIPNVEIFTETELFFNITKHVFQPTFELYTGELIYFKIDQLPILSVNDKICKFYKFQVNDLIKITDQDTGFVTIKVVK